MRGLNLLTHNQDASHSWSDYQAKQLALLNEPGVRIAFPGSLLCNHLLVPANDKQHTNAVEFQLPDVSDVVYEYCSRTERNPLLNDAIVLDSAENLNAKLIARVVAETAASVNAERIVVLGKIAYIHYGDAIKRQCGENLEVSLFEPDWLSAFELYSIYRQSSLVLSVNTMRALDVVCTGCEGTMVVDRKFRDEPVFSVLRHYLQSSGCSVLDESGLPVEITDEATIESYRIVENNITSVKHALQQVETVGGLNQDWLEVLYPVANVQVDEKNKQLVIKPYRSRRNQLLTGLRDKKTGIVRKAVKLRDDPVAFFSDSSNKVIRLVGRIARRKP